MLIGFVAVLIACSTKRDSFKNRNMHALSTKYNILYNGDIALETGVEELKSTYNDNFWNRIPVERMQVAPDETAEIKEKNPNFERAETKAIKAIQKHSMNIGGSEKNPQMDEAHLMLGKARYYEQRYVPALEAFNYVLYKYPKSDKIYEVKIWREKTNMRMDNDALAITNLRKLLSEIKFKDQIFADANATLAQAFLNLEQKDSAIVKLQLAHEFTKSKEEKARYQFILGQLYEEIGETQLANESYQNVINMKRNSPRQYVIQSHVRQARSFDYKSGDTIVFTEKFNDLLKDRENRRYLDAINHQYALFYEGMKNPNRAVKYYNASLNAQTDDKYLTASNYRNLAEIYFDRAKYVSAGQYYDSTMVFLEPRSRELKAIQKKRDNLVDVIKYEGIAQRNDSIISIFDMPESGRVAYYEAYISKLKKEDERKAILAAKESDKQIAMANDLASADKTASVSSRKAPTIQGSGASKVSDFYFYNPTTVAYGKNEFRKNWGERKYGEDWRLTRTSAGNNVEESEKELTPEQMAEREKAIAAANEKYTTDFYIKQLPTSQTVIDSIAKERNFAYYQLGVIYKEKFKEYALAANKLESLLSNQPEERLILPSMYNLYKIYEIIDPSKAELMKNRIISTYPDSRYAQILSSSDIAGISALTPENAYERIYKQYEEGDYRNVFIAVNAAIDQYMGEEMVPRFELLKANTIGKLRGIEDYKKALNYVALTYPNDDQGKNAEALLRKDVVLMENLQFNDREPRSWKVLYRSSEPAPKNITVLQDKIKKMLKGRNDDMNLSFDLYTTAENFVVIHGMKTEESANGIATIMKDYKDYKVVEKPIIISSDNYSVVQIRKNLEEYLADPKKPAIKRDAPVINEATVEQKAAPINPRATRAQEPTRSSNTPLPPSPNGNPSLNGGKPQNSGGIGMPPQDDDVDPTPKKR